MDWECLGYRSSALGLENGGIRRKIVNGKPLFHWKKLIMMVESENIVVISISPSMNLGLFQKHLEKTSACMNCFLEGKVSVSHHKTH